MTAFESTAILILSEHAKPIISKACEHIVASWFETAQERLLSMRVRTD